MVAPKWNNKSESIKTIRQMTINEWSDLIRNEIAMMIDQKSKNCLNCLQFDHKEQLCYQAKQMPPPRIAVTGCELWEEEIPF